MTNVSDDRKKENVKRLNMLNIGIIAVCTTESTMDVFVNT